MKALDRITKRKLQNRKARIARAAKALSVAHGAWLDFALQLPGNTEEEQQFNRESFEFRSEAWLAFCRVYAEEVEGS